ncbi:mutS like protein [Cavenderia fasciculata]|uniref:MutS like protein n=1 Tax=Cavenderia fasciculata TaxID=261658 RepID=F4QB11_CACFS|nr:mutS like protein [Cavenderia fasciculata]EGG14783.1 mutS like protein [Cavenderia fasciculata]|eukprot:XP_004351299.1 mutS like protein [Cavenderia fasciculata]
MSNKKKKNNSNSIINDIQLGLDEDEDEIEDDDDYDTADRGGGTTTRNTTLSAAINWIDNEFPDQLLIQQYEKGRVGGEGLGGLGGLGNNKSQFKTPTTTPKSRSTTVTPKAPIIHGTSTTTTTNSIRKPTTLSSSSLLLSSSTLKSGVSSSSISSSIKSEQIIKNTPPSFQNDNNRNGNSGNSNSRPTLAVIYNKLKLGIAYYDHMTSTLSMSESWEDDSFNCLTILKQQIKPKMIIVPSRMPQKFIDQINLNETPEYESVIYTAKQSDFDYDLGKTRLFNLKLPCQDDFHAKSHYLETQIKATSGLLSYLSKFLALDEFETLENLQINEIQHISLDQYLHMDINSLYSLQIFSNEQHPSCYSFGNSKEGLSLFGILNKTKSKIGKRMLKSWFMRPSRQRTIIEDRLDVIEWLLDQSQSTIIQELLVSIGNIRDLHMILNRLSLSQSPCNDLISIYNTLYNYFQIITIIENSPDTPNLIKGTHIALDSIKDLFEHFENTFSLEHILKFRQLYIRDGFDQQLDKLREVFNSMSSILTNTGEIEKTKFSRITWIESFHFVYYPQLGCLICIPISHTVPIQTQKNIKGLKFLFQTSQYIYFQNEKTKELDEYFGDIHHDIIDIQSRIERSIVDKVLENVSQLVAICNYCSQLDCFISLALASKELNFVKPTINNEHRINIVNGRHPLQEICVQTFIPNDTKINTIDNIDNNINNNNNEKKQFLFITGPNQSGKSIYLKQVAIIVFLTHLGCFVPASSADICLCDRIFTRVSSRESCMVSESSFMIDCKQISQMTRFSTSNSLLIIDEFGKGTNPKDGISILYSLIEFLLFKDNAPITLMCTHFYELFDLFTPEMNNQILFNSMEFIIDDSNSLGLDISNYIPLYKLINKKSTQSFGLTCAMNAGVSKDILIRTMEIIKHQMKFKTINCNYFEPLPTTEKESNRIQFYNQLLDSFSHIEDNLQSITPSLENLLNLIKSRNDIENDKDTREE